MSGFGGIIEPKIMTIVAEKQCLSKPFLKLAGGKTQLINKMG